MKPYNLANAYNFIRSFSLLNTKYFQKNEFSIPLIASYIRTHY